MRETVILAPGINGAELLRSLARYGRNTIGCRVMSSAELARTVLMRNGIAVQETFIPRKDEPSVVDSFLRQIPYFQNASYADAESVSAALYTLCTLIPENEGDMIRETLPKGEFPEKNEALLEAYERYLAKLSAAGIIDTVGLIREALKPRPFAEGAEPECPRLPGTDILTLKEYPLTPLERKLAEQLSGDTVKESTLTALFGRDEKPLKDVSFTECYGASNEVRDIISYIFKNNIPLDTCTVAVTDTMTYAGLFSELASEYDIPVSFGCGLPLTVSNPARLLKLYQTWNTSGYRGTDALSALILSDAFDRKRLETMFTEGGPTDRKTWKKIIKVAGSLRLSAKHEENRKKLDDCASAMEELPYRYEDDRSEAKYCLSCAEVLASEMEKGPAYLIRNYSKIREGGAGRTDRSAVMVITGMIDAYLRYAASGSDIDGVIPAILNKTVSSENSREGCLHVCGIAGAMAVPREHLFIAGLSASRFPGSPAEDHLLLDSDLDLFGADAARLTSSARIKTKKQVLDDLLAFSASLGLSVRLSYPSSDLAALKDENPSSVLHEIFASVHPEKTDDGAFEGSLEHAGFFKDGLSRHHGIGKAYIGGTKVVPEWSANDGEQSPGGQPYMKWSPSSIEVFFSCPRRFYLTKILKIDEPDTDDPFQVIAANDTGTLAHSLMEALSTERYTKDDFLAEAGKAFDRFLLTRPPVHEDDAAREKERFLRMMENAYGQDPGRETVLSEEEQTVEHPSGITLYGFPDRVEKTEDGRYLIVDFKTGQRIKHEKDDIETCLQVLIYAYMMEQAGLDVAGCEYRYLRNAKTVTCRYDEDMKAKLDGQLRTFHDALISGYFPCTADRDNCSYCDLKGICGRDESSEETEAGGDD